MKILVTGGCGFIGSYVVEQLMELGHDVTNLDCLTYAAAGGRRLRHMPLEGGRYTMHKVDVSHYGEVAAIMGAVAWDAVIHMAAETHVDRSIDDGSAFMQTNVNGTYVMLDAVRAYCPEARFVYVSTDEVYGPMPGIERAWEEHKLHPKNPYAATKAASEHLVEAYCNTFGLKAVITRGTNTMGPMQAPEKFIPMACFRVMRGLPIPIYGDGQQEREWLHVADHARMIAELATCNEEKLGFQDIQPWVFNIGAPCSFHTNIAMAESIVKALEPRWPNASIEHVEDRPGHDARYSVFGEKLWNTFHWFQFRELETTLWETVKWCVDCGEEFWKDELEDLLQRRGTL
jgi:dTDP-glucose 4,6-dehydratase